MNPGGVVYSSAYQPYQYRPYNRFSNVMMSLKDDLSPQVGPRSSRVNMGDIDAVDNAME